MDKKTLIAIHKAKNKKTPEQAFLDKCANLKQKVAEEEEAFKKLPPFEELTDSNERFKWLAAKSKLEEAKANLRIARSVYTSTCYDKGGIMAIPITKIQQEPGE